MKLIDLILSKSIYKMFEIDLQAKPDNTFIESEEENPIVGKQKHYKKRLEYKECGIFDEVEVIKTGENNQNVVLRGCDTIVGDKLCKIVMDITLSLYTIFGEDDNGKGLFAPDEIRLYNIGIFQRNYSKSNMYVSLYNMENMLCMSILGIETK